MRASALALLLALAACASSASRHDTHDAAERARREQAASGEPPATPPEGESWGGWRYEGARDDCFFVVGRTCFADQDAACEAAKCAKGCVVEGGGPATVSCR